MSSKAGKFANKAKNILGTNEKISISDFLEDSGQDNNIYQLPVELIQNNPYQPRQNFDEEKLQELADSIKLHGIIQPIVVRKDEDDIILVAGERRLRATKLAGLENIPAILTQGNALEISLIENLVREDLDPFEEADALQTMIEEYKYTQENLAKVVGKNRTSITRSLSLNKIPKDIKEKCARVHIPKRTLIEIARLKTEEEMASAVDKVINFDFKAEDVRKETKKKRESQEKPEATEIAYKKVKTFKKYIEVLEEELDENYTDVLREVAELQKKLDHILNKFER